MPKKEEMSLLILIEKLILKKKTMGFIKEKEL